MRFRFDCGGASAGCAMQLGQGMLVSQVLQPASPCIRSQSVSVIRISRAWLPLYWPTMPSSAMKSMSRAARP